ncbi:unnamed protein product [Strongylus vulgaris]|uniref:glycerol-3-phosphate dehydrogenase n=1 Tax=Strongylus vulgaris TaxID=40348 RepID=A0A3P7JJH7_STRVU|nr:unnamed protein product [Strongylus vulgaris]
MLKSDALKGALIYYDGTHNDARMNLAIVLTAIRHGAKCVNHTKVESLLKDENGKCVNHTKVESLLKDENGKVIGAHVRDTINGNEWDIKAKVIVNATGPSTDTIRIMADPQTKPICVPSSGVHIVLPGYYRELKQNLFSPSNTGLLDPDTSDGRVIFFLPWERMTIAGTTDAPSEVTLSPIPKDSDVEFILQSSRTTLQGHKYVQEIRGYLSKDVSIRRGDVMSSWAGLRPLVRDPNKKDTKSLARNHIIEVKELHSFGMRDRNCYCLQVSKSGLVTIAGGKWTTYRHMAEETVDTCVKVGANV